MHVAMMKSDKAVCTNDTMEEDLGKALTYEAIFTTLIENKVLAMKRDCEERKRAKRQKRKSFGRILFSKKLFGSSASGGTGGGSGSGSGGRKSPSAEELDVEKGSSLADDFEINVTSKLSDCHIHDETTHSKVSSKRHHHPEADASMRRGKNATIKVLPQIPPGDDSLSSNAYNDSLSLSEKNGVRNLVVEVLTHHHDARLAYDDDAASIADQVAPISLNDTTTVDQSIDAISICSNSIAVDEHNTSTMADDSLTSIRDSIESLSFPSSRCTVSVSGFGATGGGGGVCPEITVNPSCLDSASLIFDKRRAKRLRILEAKSISAQCSPVLPRHIKPTISNRVSKFSAAHTQTTQNRGVTHQVSFSNDTETGRTEHEKLLISRQNTSEDSANLTVSTLLNEAEEALIANSSKDHSGRRSKSTSLLVISSKDNLNKQSLSSRLDSNNRNTVNQILAPGRESFVAYTTTSNYFPVITTTTIATANGTATTAAAASAAAAAETTSSIHYATAPIPTLTTPTTTSSAIELVSKNGNAVMSGDAINSKGGGNVVYVKAEAKDFVPAPSSSSAIVPSAMLPSDTAKLHRMTSTSTGSSVAPTGCCATKSRDKEKRYKPSWPSGQSGSDDEYRKRKRKYKRHHRCSDPVLVYPSPSGLQHCILSMPPNQPIQFHYNEDFVYDMTLQVESDKNDDLQEIVPSSRNRKHRHHKHKKRHRHKKPKILVHDLDTQTVKVIDPDDLPQRARWTIIATAFLLLIMCLMLVGITLRMAPIIDDMVRQENERLMQESINRARLAKNFTDAASLSAAAEQIP
ncbi:uncharacterized protein LOC129948813 [Eupeodes corollae]|uniref:uncharacterized protein LOC129948813 n=1 Tax=Eupeodes corollae TaxID=290404 RepID=UPI0024904C52|nr:uncharacterized protein LOC129948813 [Eupeodes corollae]XP_055915848.1 uncharacterized protein LOC129948813 [Eupeodes corollae]